MTSQTLRVVICCCIPALMDAAATQQPAPRFTRESGAEVFSYSELLTLGSNEPLSPALSKKLSKLLTTPFVNNEAYYRKAAPYKPVIGPLGPSLRVVEWNIERGDRKSDV